MHPRTVLYCFVEPPPINKDIQIGGIHKKSTSRNRNPSVFLVFLCSQIALIKI